jgi:hypothetical protein
MNTLIIENVRRRVSRKLRLPGVRVFPPVSVSIINLEFDFLGWALLGFYFILLAVVVGHAVAQLVEALRYEPEDCGFDSRWCHWNFSLT